MSNRRQRLELTWVGKDERPRLEPRILIEDAEKSFHAKKRVTDHDIFDNLLIRKHPVIPRRDDRMLTARPAPRRPATTRSSPSAMTEASAPVVHTPMMQQYLRPERLYRSTSLEAAVLQVSNSFPSESSTLLTEALRPRR